MADIARPQSRHPGRTRTRETVASVFALGAAIAVPLILTPSIAFANVDQQFSSAFAGAPVVSAAELARQRGGFMLPSGLMVNFGMEVQQFVNNTLTNDVKADFSAQNHFTVTQTHGDTTTMQTYTQLPPGGLSFPTTSNGGLTQQTVNIVNNTIQSLVQNSANGQSLKTVTTVNIATQGLANLLHQAGTNSQVMNAIHMSSWMHH